MQTAVKSFSSRVMEGGKELAVSLRIIIPINLFTHLPLGTSEGPKTCQAITQLHRSMHKIFCITLASVCARYIGTSSTCVRWQQRKQLFWETKSISTVAKPCPCFGKSDLKQQHLLIFSGKKVYKTRDPLVADFHSTPRTPNQYRDAQGLLVTPANWPQLPGDL